MTSILVTARVTVEGKNREEICKEIKHNFPTEKCLTVHQDGKLLPDVSKKEKVERLPTIVIRIHNMEEILEIPKLKDSTDKSQAEAVFKILQEYNLVDIIQTTLFDTTPSNTGTYFFKNESL